MAKAVCSTADFTPDDQRRYTEAKGKTVKGKWVPVAVVRAQLVDDMILEAEQERISIIREVQRIHPDLVTPDGDFTADLRALARMDEAQLEMDVEEGVQKQTAEDINAKQKEEREARSPKPSTKKLVRKKQPKGTGDVTTAKPKKLTVAAKKSKRKQAKTPKADEEKSKPLDQGEQKPVERKEQQPTDLEKAASKKAAKVNREKLDAEQQAADERLTLPKQMDEYKDRLTRFLAGSKNWRDAAAAIMSIALLGPVEVVKLVKGEEKNVNRTAAYENARDMVFGRGPDQELLWGGTHYAGATTVLHQLIVDEVRSKTKDHKSPPTFNEHKTLWGVANLYNLAPSILRELTIPDKGARPIFPTSPPSWIQTAMPRTHNWKKHGVEVTDAEAQQIIEETNPATAEEMSNHDVHYKSSENENVEEAFDDVYEDILDEYGPGRGKIFDTNNKEITKPISLGNATMAVGRFMRKLFNKNISARVYKNVAEFKRKAPELYAQATASRSDKKVIPNHAAGYSFIHKGKGHVLIFSDNIATIDQLNFTIAHEVIGHFGLGSIMPKKNFVKLMNDVYARDGKIRDAADLLVEMRGMDKHEAIEEALADAAAHLDTSMIARIGAAIKRFFRALGVKFDDDMTTYFLHHSRRYQRTGQTPDASPYAVLQEFRMLDEMAGRASPGTTEFYNLNIPISKVPGGGTKGMAGRLQRVIDSFSTVESATDTLKNIGKTTGRVLEFIQSFDNIALRSRPLRELFEIMTLQKQRLEALKTDLGDMLVWVNSSRMLEDAAVKMGFKKAVTGKERAPSDKEKARYGIAAVWINRSKADKNNEASLDKSPRLDEIVDGRAERSEAGWKYSRDRGHMTRDEINKGFLIKKIDDEGNVVVERDSAGSIIYYDSKGKITTDKDKNGDQVGSPKAIMEPKKLDFEVTERIYRLIEDNRLATDTIALHVHLDKVNGMLEEQNAEFDAMQEEQNLYTAELDAVKKVQAAYNVLYNDGAKLEGAGMKWKQASIDRARHFSHHVTRILDSTAGKLKRDDWLNGPSKDDDKQDMGPFLDPSTGTHKVQGEKDPVKNGTHRAVIKEALDAMLAAATIKKGRNVSHEKIHVMIQNMYFLETQLTNSDLYAKSTIQDAYTPLKRRGKFQVRMQGYTVSKDDDNETVYTPVALPESISNQLYYTRMDSQEDASKKAKEINEMLEKHGAVTMLPEGGQKGDEVEVVFRTNWGVAEEGSALMGSISYDALASVLVRAGVHISPTDRAQLVQLTASEHSTARSNLKKDWSPGYDPNIVRSVAEHLERQAHIAAKNLHQHRVARLMINETGNWEGDPKLLGKMQAAFLVVRAKGNQAAIKENFMELAKYQWQFVSSAPIDGDGVANIKIYKQDGSYEMVLGHGKGKQYLEKAKAILTGYNRTMNVAVTGDEMLATQGSWLMSGTAILQLGGALAPALINMTALESHTIPYLATMNNKTGYGGGHGFQKSFTAVHKAMADLSLLKDGLKDMTGSAKNIKTVIDDGTWKKYFADIEEAQDMYALTLEGVTTPNMYNAMSDVARSGHADSVITKAADKWMILFSKSEQFNRRVTALASYRLDKARMLEARDGKPLTAKDRKTLRDRATDAVNFSQGNYDSFNRPAWAQGNVGKYLWMYKQFQVITVQLMRNLAPREQAMMIGLLFVLSGIKGVPFGEDLLDLIDTLMQKFNIKSAGVEAELTILLKNVPGAAEMITTGFANIVFGTTTSNRFSQGDLIPGTGMFKAGADKGRTWESIFGPVFGAWFGQSGVVNSAATFAQYAAETVGLKDDVTSFADVLRTGGGASAIKNYMKGAILMVDGTITNERGQVVAKDAGIWAAITQLMGFYPLKATNQYAVIRMTNQARDYAQAIKTSYIEASLKAGTSKEKRAIARQVREWNKEARGSIFFIRDFSGSLNRARKAARLSASGRNIKTLPKGMKKFGKGIMKSRQMDTKGIPFDN